MSGPLSPGARKIVRTIAVALIVLIGGCERMGPAVFSHDVDDLLSRGRAFVAALPAQPAEQLTDEEVLALGYMERARLGLGSPFRLASYVQRDARLSPETQQALSYALLDYTLREQGYQLHPMVLDVIRLTDAAREIRTGGYHLQLIEQSIRQAPTAQSGERAVRLGYMLADAERVVQGVPQSVLAHAVAMLADRRKAREDAVDLLRDAVALGTDPLELLEERRKQLALRVEQPALGPVTAREEMVEAARGPQIAASLRVLGHRLSVPGNQGRARAPNRFWSDSWLSPAAATRLLVLAEEHDYPAQAPIAVAVAINRDALLSWPGMEPWQRDARSHFADAAFNEERLTAAAARLHATRAAQGPRLPLIVLQASIFLRGWNQEEPWFPGDPAPSAKDLEARFGLARISFDSDVPESWKPYYRRMLARGLGDLQRVLPTASVRGLGVRFGTIGPETPALALHEPGPRTLVLPPLSGAGTLAHEVAHDLDWQLARKRYGRRGSYATDMSVRYGKGDRIAASLHGLTASFARDAGANEARPHDARPAEVFARGADWLIAAQLAHDGRMGGYLTSYQDAALTGYGSTRSPDIGGSAVPALLNILDQVAPVSPDARRWALETYGPSRTLLSKEIVRIIVSAGEQRSAAERLRAIEVARDRVLESLTAESCQMKPSEEVRRLTAARQRLLRIAVEAATRGAIVEGVQTVAPTLEEPVTRGAVDDFLAWRLDGAPEPADSAVLGLLPTFEVLRHRASEIADFNLTPTAARFDLGTPVFCNGNPFALQAQSRWSGAALQESRRVRRRASR